MIELCSEYLSMYLYFLYVAVSSLEFLDIQATTECRLTLKRVRDKIIT